ncbi:MAG: diacylglycerol kinase family lipid kinase [Solirubrobacterales bacterium]|nr:diacylglycerol kinase family lipid kinase [Solirubrobacterales bacterium]
MTHLGPDPATAQETRMISLIVNPAAGGGRAGRLLGEVGNALSRHGLRHHVEPTRSLDHAQELAAAAAAAGELAVAFGGDGLIAAVAAGLRDTQGVLGLLPGGRGNDLARVLGIPPDPVAACQVLVSGVVRPLDLGQAGERTFIGIASCGFDSEANRIANQTRLVKGNLVYAYGAIRALAGWRPATFELTLDGHRQHGFTGYSVAAANSKAYGGGMYAAPGAELDDGLLDIVTCADMPKWRLPTSLLPKVFKGAHVDEPEVTVLRAREVTITADRPFVLYADGDPIAELPVTVRVLPGAVSVLLPR